MRAGVCVHFDVQMGIFSPNIRAFLRTCARFSSEREWGELGERKVELREWVVLAGGQRKLEVSMCNESSISRAIYTYICVRSNALRFVFVYLSVLGNVYECNLLLEFLLITRNLIKI